MRRLNYVISVLSSIVITSSGKEGAGRFAGCILVYPHFVVSRFSTLLLFLLVPKGALQSLIVAHPGYIVFCQTVFCRCVWCVHSNNVAATLIE